MESTVSFRMHHGTQPEKVPFIGNGIRLLELKREILERKKISGSLDFDLKVVDESGRGTKNNLVAVNWPHSLPPINPFLN